LKKRALILVNLGTPETLSFFAVARYLRAFLNDGRVIDIFPLFRFLFVHFLIVPFRTHNSLKMYRKIWLSNGSPLLVYSNKLKDKLKETVSSGTDVYMAMRFGSPGLDKCLESVERGNYSQIILVPLFPQYASSTSGTIISRVLERISKWNTIPDIRVIASFFDHPQYIRSMVNKLRNGMKNDENQHVLFSFHSLPLRHVRRFHDGIDCGGQGCRDKLDSDGAGCYLAACYETARLISKGAGIKEHKYSVSFQSRFSRQWLGPFTADVLKELAGKGTRDVVVIAPSFVTDCLETNFELDREYRHLFLSQGGKSYILIQSLNDDEMWVKALARICIPQWDETR
jgi:ferrochelatase